MIAYDFLCDDCGYTEHVSGGRDPLRLCVRETMTCHDCRRLVDVLVTVREPNRVGETWSGSAVYKELRSAPRGRMPALRRLRSSEVGPWEHADEGGRFPASQQLGAMPSLQVPDQHDDELVPH